MSPKVVDKAQKKKEIALAALEVFSEKGFETASISDVAEAAGIGKGTVYQYFDSKEELIAGALASWLDGFEAELEALLDQEGDPCARLRQYAHMAMQMFLEQDQLMRLFLRLLDLIIHQSEQVKRLDLANRMFSSPRRYVTGLILEGVSAGLYRPEIARDAEKIATNFLAFSDGIGFHYFLSEGYCDLLEQVDFHVDNLLRSLRVDGGTGR